MTAKSLRNNAFLSLVILSLAACAAHEEAAQPSVDRPQVSTAQPKQTARAPAPTRVEPEVPAPKPDEILGAPSSKLVSELGSATLVRTDIGAEIWQYRTDECVLFLFLYPGEHEMAVKHIDYRGGPSPETCIRSVVKAKVSRKLG